MTELPQHIPPPASVPVFSCVVYVSPASGGVRARCANLAGLEFTAGNERAVLGQLIPAFKKQVGQLHAAGQPIPWIDPPTRPEPGEQTRYVPVHL